MTRASGARDLVHIHVTDNLPIQGQALPFADRVEIRFGRAFPVALVVDAGALDRLADALASARSDLEAAVGKAGDKTTGGPNDQR